jgi:putative transposase
VEGRVKTIQVRRQGRRWMLVLSCDEVPTGPRTYPSSGRYRCGIASLATTSDGQHVPNPRCGGSPQPNCPRPTVLARKRRVQQPSQARETLAARHRKLANQRRNFHHHVARALVARYGLLVVEDLRIRNMVRRPAPPRSRPAGRVPA